MSPSPRSADPMQTLFGDLPVLDDDVGLEQAYAVLDEHALADGLPQLPPTRSRLGAMLATVRDPAHEHAMLAPTYAPLTAAAVAYQCVLAGCEPAALPVVLSAAHACAEPAFNLLGILTTTGTPTATLCVHNPLARRLGVNAGGNCLGPGHRVNASIGRALSLVFRNIGGARPGIGDMATMGQPGKIGICFGENDEDLLPPLHVRRGFEPDAEVVTVLGTSGTVEVLPIEGGATPESILDPAATAMAACYLTGGAARRPQAHEQYLLVPPELARVLSTHGWSLQRCQGWLLERSTQRLQALTAVIEMPAASTQVAHDAPDIHIIVTGGTGVKMTYLPPWGGGTLAVSTALVQP
ncbi:MAG: hypothetical protein KDK91_08550 [Gammaproteobacteria bacterium]|nr:hypothetical protein [Gammaproteobacteria bacterium]